LPLRARVASSHSQKKFGITCPLLLCSDHLLKNFFKSLLDSAEVCASNIGAMRLEAVARAPAARAPAARAPAARARKAPLPSGCGSVRPLCGARARGDRAPPPPPAAAARRRPPPTARASLTSREWSSPIGSLRLVYGRVASQVRLHPHSVRANTRRALLEAYHALLERGDDVELEIAHLGGSGDRQNSNAARAVLYNREVGGGGWWSIAVTIRFIRGHVISWTDVDIDFHVIKKRLTPLRPRLRTHRLPSSSLTPASLASSSSLTSRPGRRSRRSHRSV